jgi:hypothetical protein
MLPARLDRPVVPLDPEVARATALVGGDVALGVLTDDGDGDRGGMDPAAPLGRWDALETMPTGLVVEAG